MLTIPIATLAILAAAPAPNILPCRPHLVPCNYAEHFSGTVRMRTVSALAADKAADGKAVESISELTVTVTAGRASCTGKIDGQAVKGEGSLAVERGGTMEDAPGQPWYSISVACPEADGKIPNIDAAQIKTYPQKDASAFKALAGKFEDDSNSDPVNGVTESVRLEWSLTRGAGPQP